MSLIYAMKHLDDDNLECAIRSLIRCLLENEGLDYESDFGYGGRTYKIVDKVEQDG